MRISKNPLKNININIKKIKSGLVLFIKYILVKEDEIKISNFVGLCIVNKNKAGTIVLKNTIKKTKITLNLVKTSPLILQIIPLKKYRKTFRLSKLYYK